VANILLVHGTGCGGWVWQKLSPLLRTRGHEVYSPTLTGLGDKKHLLNEHINLTTHITDVVNLAYYEDLEDVILIGNSYGGMVITGVAAKIFERIKLLIYLDAYLPGDGESEADLLPKAVFDARRQEATAHGGVISPPPPEIFGITEPELSGWVKARMTVHPFDTYTEPVHWDGHLVSSIPTVYIHCTGNPPKTPDLFSTSASKARSRGALVVELQAGHLAMLTQPQLVADIIFKAIHQEDIYVTHTNL
jgi:pimeloyl-ACP methyl ester carboxylesterase